MKKATRFVGLDVHAQTIAVAVAEAGRNGEVRSVGTVPNRPQAVRKLIQKLGGPKGLKACYEAGPTGFALYWELTRLGVECEVVAPTLVPVKAGDRVKTDRRDALKLARCYRAGDLTAVWVPDEAHEALRDLVRARETAKRDQVRARNRLTKFLLRLGKRPPTEGLKAWSRPFMEWARALRFEHAAHDATLLDHLNEVDHVAARLERLEKAIDDAVAGAPPRMRAVIEGLQALKGFAKLAATTLAVEVGDFSRFEKASQLMAYAGATPSEFSSGESRRQGGITKTGNARIRRVLFEIAWAYRHRPRKGPALQKRQQGLPAHLVEIGWKAQHRLHQRYVTLSSRGKHSNKVVTAIARELLGFAWAIGTRVERDHAQEQSPARAAA